MKKYIYIIVLLILGGGGFFFFYEEEKPSRFLEESKDSKCSYFENFYQEQALRYFFVMGEQIALYENKTPKKKIQSYRSTRCYKEYMNWLHDCWVYNENEVNFFSDLILKHYHSLPKEKLNNFISLKKEDYPSEFWKWLDSPVRNNIKRGDLDPSQDRLYKDLAEDYLREAFELYQLNKDINPKNTLQDLGALDLRREVVRYSFLYYLLLRAGKIEKNFHYESTIFYLYKKSEGSPFSRYYEDPLPSVVSGSPSEEIKEWFVPAPYVGMSERKYKKLTKEFLQFVEEGKKKEWK